MSHRLDGMTHLVAERTHAAERYEADGMILLRQLISPVEIQKIRDVFMEQVETDRVKQGKQWAALNTQAMKDAVAVPLRYDTEERLVGSRVHGAYVWAPYGSLPYAALWVS